MEVHRALGPGFLESIYRNALLHELRLRSMSTKAAWRTRSGVEVDFVVYGSAGFWAIEVTNTARVRDEDFRALEAFCSDYPQAEAALLYRGARRERRGKYGFFQSKNFSGRSILPEQLPFTDRAESIESVLVMKK